MSRALRTSLHRRFLARRLTDGVFFLWSLVRGVRSRNRTRLSSRPATISPSEVVAMFTMPRSIPRKSTGSTFSSVSGTSQVARRNHMPSRHTRLDSPLRYSSTVASRSGAAVNATSLIRPETVQIETRRSAVRQDSIRSS